MVAAEGTAFCPLCSPRTLFLSIATTADEKGDAPHHNGDIVQGDVVMGRPQYPSILSITMRIYQLPLFPHTLRLLRPCLLWLPFAADEDGDTPLHNAARGNHAEVVQLLLSSGADPLAVNAGERR